MRVLTLYSKVGCHLCDEMEAIVERAASRGGARLEIVDITSDPALLDRYRHDIPVLLLDNREIARHRTTEAAIAEKLAASSGTGTGT